MLNLGLSGIQLALASWSAQPHSLISSKFDYDGDVLHFNLTDFEVSDKSIQVLPTLSALNAIVFQIKILRRLEGGDHTGVYLRPITHSKSLSGKLYHAGSGVGDILPRRRGSLKGERFACIT